MYLLITNFYSTKAVSYPVEAYAQIGNDLIPWLQHPGSSSAIHSWKVIFKHDSLRAPALDCRFLVPVCLYLYAKATVSMHLKLNHFFAFKLNNALLKKKKSLIFQKSALSGTSTFLSRKKKNSLKQNKLKSQRLKISCKL